MSPIRDELTPTSKKETTTVNANNHDFPPSSPAMDQQPKENHKDESTYQDSIEESDMELDACAEKLEQKLLSSTPARSETMHQNSDFNKKPIRKRRRRQRWTKKRVTNLRETYRQIRRPKTTRRKK